MSSIQFTVGQTTGRIPKAVSSRCPFHLIGQAAVSFIAKLCHAADFFGNDLQMV